MKDNIEGSKSRYVLYNTETYIKDSYLRSF